jgi:hypothetical protein
MRASRCSQDIPTRWKDLMLRRFLDKRVDEDWLHTNFPCMMACPAGTNAGRYVWTHCGRPL